MIECKAKHVKEDRMQEPASLGIPVKEVYIIYLFELNACYEKCCGELFAEAP